MIPQKLAGLWTADLTSAVRERILRIELVIFIAIAIITGGAWLFVKLAEEVMEGSTRALDEQLLLALRTSLDDLNNPIGPPWVEEMMRDFTALGGMGVLTFLVLVVFVYLLLQGKTHGAFFTLGIVLGGMLLSLLLKEGFDRPRPDLVPHGSYVLTASFPSGHSMLSAVVYLTLGAMLARLLPTTRLKIYIVTVAALLTFFVGVSRVYLGVHWPTDVLAGWAAGAVWATACWLIVRRLQRRGQVETDAEPVDQG